MTSSVLENSASRSARLALPVLQALLERLDVDDLPGSTPPAPDGSPAGAARPRGRQARPRGGRPRQVGPPTLEQHGHADTPRSSRSASSRRRSCLARSSASRSSSASSLAWMRECPSPARARAGRASTRAWRRLLVVAHRSPARRGHGRAPPGAPSSPSRGSPAVCSRRTSFVSREFMAWACLPRSRGGLLARGPPHGGSRSLSSTWSRRSPPERLGGGQAFSSSERRSRSSRKVWSCSVSRASRSSTSCSAEAILAARSRGRLGGPHTRPGARSSRSAP